MSELKEMAVIKSTNEFYVRTYFLKNRSRFMVVLLKKVLISMQISYLSTRVSKPIVCASIRSNFLIILTKTYKNNISTDDS